MNLPPKPRPMPDDEWAVICAAAEKTAAAAPPLTEDQAVALRALLKPTRRTRRAA